MEGVTQSVKGPLHNSSSPKDKEPEDLSKLLKWQEDRIARRLRGEYESAVLHLSDVVRGDEVDFLIFMLTIPIQIQGNMASNMNISAVRVEGAKTTRSSFLGFLINPLLASSTPKDSPTNLESVLHTTRRISHILQKTDMFHSIEAKIERARDVMSEDGDVDIIFKTREKGRFYLNTSTELGNNEGNAVCRVIYRRYYLTLMTCRQQRLVSATSLAVPRSSKRMSRLEPRHEGRFAGL